MSTMTSIRLAFDRDRDGRDDDSSGGLPLSVIAIIIVVALAVVVGLADLRMLPNFAADDAGSIVLTHQFTGGG